MSKDKKSTKGPFDKYHKKINGVYQIDRLNEGVCEVAIKCWRLKGITNIEKLSGKLGKLQLDLRLMTLNKKIAVGNSYTKSIDKLKKENSA